MRRIREITAEEENFRGEAIAPGAFMVRRDPVEPEPVGTIVLLPFRVTGYDQDCDGSLMARLESIDLDGRRTGWDPDCIGLGSGLVVGEAELAAWAEQPETRPPASEPRGQPPASPAPQRGKSPLDAPGWAGSEDFPGSDF